MGYNIQMNSLQLMRAYAMFVNGGYFIQPTLIRKIVKNHPDGTEEMILDNTNKERIKNFPKKLDEKIGRTVVNAMKYVTKPGGSARRADIWGYTEAGKTSTTEKLVNGAYSHTIHRNNFLGFTPVSKPAFLLWVTMDEPEYGYIPGVGKKHFGGITAAPVFREIARRSLDYLGIPPDDPFGYPAGDPRHQKDKADWVPEALKLQEMYEKWNNK
jgi:cell division protein FtsI (penicillin-binding protein 3)